MKHVAFALIASTAQPALACYPDPDATYDDISNALISIVTAQVVSVEFRQSGAGTCWTLSYDKAEYLFGAGPNAFNVETCVSEVHQLEALQEDHELIDAFGYFEGAKVAVSVVTNADQTKVERYAIPGCWGPIHVNLDLMPPEVFTDMLAEIETVKAATD